MTKEVTGETFQHVAEMDTLKTFCAAAAQFDECLIQNDVKRAFLEGDPQTPMYAYPPDYVKSPKSKNGRSKIWRITGNLYGKGNAPRVFGRCYDGHVLKFPSQDAMGNTTTIKRGTADPSTWHFERTYADGAVARLDMLVYVDDSLSKFSNDKYGWCLHKDVCDHMLTRFQYQEDDFGLQYGRPADSFLGCKIDRDWEAHTITLSVPGKIDQLLHDAGMADCNGSDLIGDTKPPLTSADSPAPHGNGEPCPKDFDYSSVCGALLWISRMVRGDMMQRSAELARFMHAPGLVHMQQAKRALRYLKGTRHVGLVFRQDPTVTEHTFSPVGFVDSNYAPDYGEAYAKFKSTTGWVFTQNNVAFSWRSRKQPVLADSSTAAELIAASDASKHAVWLRRLYGDLGYGHADTPPTVLFEDNEACLKLSKNYCGHGSIGHLDIRASLIREHYDKQLVDIQPVASRDQLADGFTKVLPAPATTRFRNWMMTGAVPADVASGLRPVVFASPP